MTFRKKLLDNWKSGLTVALVAMPLSISLAVASGTTPVIGIITAIWAGLIASIFGGSNFNVVGPTGALSGLIAAFAVTHGSQDLPTLTIVSGVIILTAYALKLERYLIFIPSSVIHGFTIGVAAIIAFNQLNPALGLYGLPKHERFFENVIESFKHASDLSIPTLIIFSIFLALLFIARKFFPKIPGALLLSPFGIVLGYISSIGFFPYKLATLGSVFGDLTFSLVHTYSFNFSSGMLFTASAIALVAILETMLSAKIADGMTHSKHNERKEMLGLGLANIAAGLAGGIPATAALARTSLNIKTGATNKISSSIASIGLACISFFLLAFFRFIPMAVIAAILVFVAILMIEKEHIIKFYTYQRSGFFLSLFVAAVTFYEDPIVGIILGTAISLLLFIEKISHGHFDIKLNTFEEGIVKSISGDQLREIQENADILLYSIEGKLAFINSRAHIDRFEHHLQHYKIVIIRLRSVYFIDLDGAEALDEIIEIAHKRDQKICFTSLSANISSLLQQISPGYRALLERGLIFTKSEDALRYFGVKHLDTKPWTPGVHAVQPKNGIST